MKRLERVTVYTALILLLAYSFVVTGTTGRAEPSENVDGYTKVTGVGGVFFKSSDPKKIAEWYGKNLGFKTDEHGAMFKFRALDNPDEIGYLQWSPFPNTTKYFLPSDKEFMINFTVRDIEKLVKELKSNGVTVVDSIESYDYGKFVHILDPENNKIELWEPPKTKPKQ